MRKITTVSFGILAVMLMLFALTACGNSSDPENEQDYKDVASEDEAEDSYDPYASMYTKSLETTFTATYDNNDSTKVTFSYPKEMSPYNDGLTCMDPFFSISLDRGTISYSDSKEEEKALADVKKNLSSQGYSVSTLKIDGKNAVKGLSDVENGAGGIYVIFYEDFGTSNYFTIRFSVAKGHVEEYSQIMDKILEGFKFH